MFYVFHGNDTFSQREELDALLAKAGDPAAAQLNTTLLDGRTTDMNEIRHHCSTPPFLSQRRLVIVHGLLGRLSGKGRSRADARFLQELVEYLPQMAPTTRLFLVEPTKLSPRNAVLVLAAESPTGHAKCFSAPSGAELVRWTRQRVRNRGGEIEPSAAAALCTFVGENLYLLSQEIEKLITYTNGECPITERHVELLTPQARAVSVFDMVDALGRRDGQTATRIYHDLLATGEHPLALLGMITRQFRLMVQVKELAPHLERAEAIAKKLKQNPYPIRKVLAQSSNYSMDQLRHVYQKLAQTDVDIKTGRVDASLALDTLIAGLSRVA